MELENRNNIYSEIKNLLENARGKVLSAINSTMTMTYYLIGKRIVEEEQKGDKNYGKYIVENLSHKLSEEFGKNFSKRNIYLMIKFYQVYSQNEIVKSMISQSQNPFKLSWTHYIRLVRIENSEERRSLFCRSGFLQQNLKVLCADRFKNWKVEAPRYWTDADVCKLL